MLKLLARILGQGADEAGAPSDKAIAEQAERLRRFDARVAEQRLKQDREAGGAVSAAAFGRRSAPAQVPAPAPAPVPAPIAPQRVAESITAVLRRQVPIRHGEPPRSWLGGLPMMPDGIDWPRGTNPEKQGEGPRPLHFVAQIACADLPPELWGGLGPREGWLLFFLDNNASGIEDGEQHRVIHNVPLGSERQPPADIGPVHDGMYTGSRFTSYMDQSEVPSIWRRWPVDLVAYPNQLHRDGPRSFGTPPDFAATLYAGMDTGADRDRPPAIAPFSWRCLGGVRKLFEAAAAAPGDIHPNEIRLREMLVAQGPLGTILEQLDAEEAAFEESEKGRLLAADTATIPESQRESIERARQYRQHRRDRRDQLAALIARYPTHEAMLDHLEAERVRRIQWRASATARFADDRAIATVDPDAPLHPDDWAEIHAMLEADAFTGWVPAYGRERTVTIEERCETSWQLVGPRLTAATHEIAADCYVDPACRHLLPDDAVALLEPWWRQLYSNRPHRLGGYHDGVQSDAEEGPTDAPLLLQLATDDAMQWCWGDAGAIYWFVPVGALGEGRFGEVECHSECH